ncbi:N-acetylneuraminate lyase B-like [Haliotis cracherodii]|uniref:N-acetylneuraminate lyase B-like n=1 Tax=Haliotis cracherodii TaxID=6455 RepID=UPI0039E8A410
MAEFRVTGLVAATFTPFDDNGDVVLSKIEAHIKYLKDVGVKHVFVNGATGEGLSLTLEERKDIAAEWVKANNGRLDTIIMHVGCANLRDTQTLAKHAVEIGVDAIAAIPPQFFRPTTVDHLVEYMRRVCEAAPTLPLYLYHVPPLTCVELNMADFLRKARGVVPSLRGIKFSSQDLPIASECVQLEDAKGHKYNILFGCDQQLISALVLGVDGAVGSTYNFMAGVYQRMMEAMDRGDMDTARKEQYRSQRTCKLLFNYATQGGSTVSCLKLMMSFAGLDVGPPRCPMRALGADDVAKYRKELEEIGFFQWYRK